MKLVNFLILTEDTQNRISKWAWYYFGYFFQFIYSVYWEIVLAFVTNLINSILSNYHAGLVSLIIETIDNFTDTQLFLVVPIFTLHLLILAVNIIEILFLIKDKKSGAVSNHKGLMRFEIGTFNRKVLSYFTVWNWKSYNLVIHTHIEILFFFIIVSVRRKNVIYIPFDWDFLLAEHQHISFVDIELNLTSFQDLYLSRTIFIDVLINLRLIECRLTFIVKSQLTFVINQNNRVHGWKYLKTDDVIFRVCIEMREPNLTGVFSDF